MTKQTDFIEEFETFCVENQVKSADWMQNHVFALRMTSNLIIEVDCDTDPDDVLILIKAGMKFAGEKRFGWNDLIVRYK